MSLAESAKGVVSRAGASPRAATRVSASGYQPECVASSSKASMVRSRRARMKSVVPWMAWARIMPMG